MVWQRPVVLIGVGLWLRVPSLLTDWAMPISAEALLRGNLDWMTTMKERLPLSLGVGQLMQLVGWVGVTAVGLGLSTETAAAGEPPRAWLQRSLRSLLRTAGVYVLTSAVLVGGFVLLLSPLAVAALVQPSAGDLIYIPAAHLGFWLLAVVNAALALCALLVGATVLMTVAPVTVAQEISVGDGMRHAWRLAAGNLERLTAVLLWCQILGAAVDLASVVAGAVVGDWAGTLLEITAGALVAPLTPLSAVCMYREANV